MIRACPQSEDSTVANRIPIGLVWFSCQISSALLSQPFCTPRARQELPGPRDLDSSKIPSYGFSDFDQDPGRTAAFTSPSADPLNPKNIRNLEKHFVSPSVVTSRVSFGFGTPREKPPAS